MTFRSSKDKAVSVLLAILAVIGLISFGKDMLKGLAFLSEAGGPVTLLIVILSLIALGIYIWDRFFVGSVDSSIQALVFMERYAPSMGLLGSLHSFMVKMGSAFKEGTLNLQEVSEMLAFAWLSTIAGVVIHIIAGMILSFERRKENEED
ncbi:MotA/TolQ/ExbB proton channel family protein [Hydrogenivirga sp. 128-5-R1-1]|uniref:MotA/TolQ/ExbB proton channel family protein n=1 Tax=Hydrogenivirga sp. 128-5-R1-1 TaxID=392423 RepID=UPI00015F33CE|nr:MotA/TolQ/ExbB proton channel family protein [Hydrogenivirga sp. 128-5-R1-1]EDP74863.1 hypothetical protein HG1285_13382 [Hydrogenivirga sp. 128-5-R1-1]